MGYGSAHLAVAHFLGLTYPVVQATVVPPSAYHKGQLPNGEGEEPVNAELAAHLIDRYHQSYATLTYGDAHVVDIPDARFQEASDRTRELIADPETHAVVRPAFFWKNPEDPEDAGIGVRGGALVRRSDGQNFSATLFKATTRVSRFKRTQVNAAGAAAWKEELNQSFLLELAIGVYVARASGVPVNQAGIVCLGGERVYQGDRDPASDFKFVNLTKEVEALLAGDEIKERIRALQAKQQMLSGLSPEELQPSVYPRTHVKRLYAIKKREFEKLREAIERDGVTHIPDIIPDDFNARHPEAPITDPIHLRQIAALKQNRMIVEGLDVLEETLRRLLTMAEGGWISSLDYETNESPVALIKGSRNGEEHILQFSNDRLDPKEAAPRHDEILFDEDPLQDGALERWDKKLAEGILDSVGPKGPIVTYNADFEKRLTRGLIRRLRKRGEEDLARRLEGILVDGGLRDLADELERKGLTIFANQLRNKIGHDGEVRKYVEHLRTERGHGANKKKPSKASCILADQIEEVLETDRFFLDPLVLLQGHLWHPDFDNLTLKTAAEVLAGKGYGDLDIRDGEMATQALKELLDPKTTPERKTEIRTWLLAYCGRDTRAVIWVLQELFKIVGLPWPWNV